MTCWRVAYPVWITALADSTEILLVYTNEKDVLGLEFLPWKEQSDTVSPNLKTFSRAFWYGVKHCVTNNEQKACIFRFTLWYGINIISYHIRFLKRNFEEHLWSVGFLSNRFDVSWLDDFIINKLTDNIVSAGNISCLSDKFPGRNFPSASLPGPNYPRWEFSKREFSRSEMLQIGTIRVGTVQVEVTRAGDILVGVAGWELSQHSLTLLRFSFGKFSMFKIKSKLFRTNKKVQQRFCSPHAFTVPVPVSS